MSQNATRVLALHVRLRVRRLHVCVCVLYKQGLYPMRWHDLLINQVRQIDKAARRGFRQIFNIANIETVTASTDSHPFFAMLTTS